ncbi:hypothetical protein CAOG_09113 [Capsaspora owczarzaki ATCC 30864]|uniref:Serine/threonine-protein kinase ATR n=1 Tax=Capsaspora owczarzaki (strain ATCC 30864) TaxID=595528 RepID=A0A0D2UQE9_CAPO3|nr:hypothetical protein CAOG_09113 [Capsaspora owczarzaki ATCC 30864]KJE97226.1 hypothetical protein CAOG_009113 [Capsaspora owczarzaki ATCC 30864]|eukprot:XP_011270770.1 hypothetical protein CAOG_09113 [Capsaspora owczarzaki ATCC 30864]
MAASELAAVLPRAMDTGSDDRSEHLTLDQLLDILLDQPALEQATSTQQYRGLLQHYQKSLIAAVKSYLVLPSSEAATLTLRIVQHFVEQLPQTFVPDDATAAIALPVTELPPMDVHRATLQSLAQFAHPPAGSSSLMVGQTVPIPRDHLDVLAVLMGRLFTALAEPQWGAVADDLVNTLVAIFQLLRNKCLMHFRQLIAEAIDMMDDLNTILDTFLQQPDDEYSDLCLCTFAQSCALPGSGQQGLVIDLPTTDHAIALQCGMFRVLTRISQHSTHFLADFAPRLLRTFCTTIISALSPLPYATPPSMFSLALAAGHGLAAMMPAAVTLLSQRALAVMVARAVILLTRQWIADLALPLPTQPAPCWQLILTPAASDNAGHARSSAADTQSSAGTLVHTLHSILVAQPNLVLQELTSGELFPILVFIICNVPVLSDSRALAQLKMSLQVVAPFLDDLRVTTTQLIGQLAPVVCASLVASPGNFSADNDASSLRIAEFAALALSEAFSRLGSSLFVLAQEHWLVSSQRTAAQLLASCLEVEQAIASRTLAADSDLTIGRSQHKRVRRSEPEAHDHHQQRSASVSPHKAVSEQALSAATANGSVALVLDPSAPLLDQVCTELATLAARIQLQLGEFPCHRSPSNNNANNNSNNGPTDGLLAPVSAFFPTVPVESVQAAANVELLCATLAATPLALPSTAQCYCVIKTWMATLPVFLFIIQHARDAESDIFKRVPTATTSPLLEYTRCHTPAQLALRHVASAYASTAGSLAAIVISLLDSMRSLVLAQPQQPELRNSMLWLATLVPLPLKSTMPTNLPEPDAQRWSTELARDREGLFAASQHVRDLLTLDFRRQSLATLDTESYWPSRVGSSSSSQQGMHLQPGAFDLAFLWQSVVNAVLRLVCDAPIDHYPAVRLDLAARAVRSAGLLAERSAAHSAACEATVALALPFVDVSLRHWWPSHPCVAPTDPRRSPLPMRTFVASTATSTSAGPATNATLAASLACTSIAGLLDALGVVVSVCTAAPAAVWTDAACTAPFSALAERAACAIGQLLCVVGSAPRPALRASCLQFHATCLTCEKRQAKASSSRLRPTALGLALPSRRSVVPPLTAIARLQQAHVISEVLSKTRLQDLLTLLPFVKPAFPVHLRTHTLRLVVCILEHANMTRDHELMTSTLAERLHASVSAPSPANSSTTTNSISDVLALSSFGAVLSTVQYVQDESTDVRMAMSDVLQRFVARASLLPASFLHTQMHRRILTELKDAKHNIQLAESSLRDGSQDVDARIKQTRHRARGLIHTVGKLAQAAEGEFLVVALISLVEFLSHEVPELRATAYEQIKTVAEARSVAVYDLFKPYMNRIAVILIPVLAGAWTSSNASSAVTDAVNGEVTSLSLNETSPMSAIKLLAELCDTTPSNFIWQARRHLLPAIVQQCSSAALHQLSQLCGSHPSLVLESKLQHILARIFLLEPPERDEARRFLQQEIPDVVTENQMISSSLESLLHQTVLLVGDGFAGDRLAMNGMDPQQLSSKAIAALATFLQYAAGSAPSAHNSTTTNAKLRARIEQSKASKPDEILAACLCDELLFMLITRLQKPLIKHNEDPSNPTARRRALQGLIALFRIVLPENLQPCTPKLLSILNAVTRAAQTQAELVLATRVWGYFLQSLKPESLSAVLQHAVFTLLTMLDACSVEVATILERIVLHLAQGFGPALGKLFVLLSPVSPVSELEQTHPHLLFFASSAISGPRPFARPGLNNHAASGRRGGLTNGSAPGNTLAAGLATPFSMQQNREAALDDFMTTDATQHTPAAAAAAGAKGNAISNTGKSAASHLDAVTALLPKETTERLKGVYAVMRRECEALNLHVDRHARVQLLLQGVAHENVIVRARALVRLRSFLAAGQHLGDDITADAATLAEMAATTTEVTSSRDIALSRIVAVLMQASKDSSPTVRLLVGECVGALGAVDPARVSIPTSLFRSKPNLVSSADASGTVAPIAGRISAADAVIKLPEVPFRDDSFAVALLSDCLVKVFLGATSAPIQDRAACAIQQVLQWCRQRLYPDSASGLIGTATWQKLTPQDRIIVQPYLSTTYVFKSTRKRARRSSNGSIYHSSIAYAAWVGFWADELLQAIQPMAPGFALLQACRGVIKDDVQTAVFLLPTLVANVLLFGNEASQNEVKVEALAVLNAAASSSSSGPLPASLSMCVQTLFAALDPILLWVRKRSSGHCPELRLDDPNLGERLFVHIDKFLAALPLNLMSHAARASRDYARAIMTYELYVQQEVGTARASMIDAAKAAKASNQSALASGAPGTSGGTASSSTLSTSSALYTVLNNLHGVPKTTVLMMDQTLQSHLPQLQELYAALDAADELAGVNAIRLNAAGIEELVLEQESAGDWTAALSLREQALGELHRKSYSQQATAAPASSLAESALMDTDEPEEDAPALHPTSTSTLANNELTAAELTQHRGVINCLLNMGQFETAIMHINGALTTHPEWCMPLNSYRVQAAWRLADWSAMDEFLAAPQQTCFDVSVGRILQHFRRSDAPKFLAELEATRNLIMPGLAAVRMDSGSYQRGYPLILQLHMLTEIEQSLLPVLRMTEESIAPTSSTAATALVNADRLLENWDARVRLTQPGYRAREPLLNLRRTLLSLLMDAQSGGGQKASRSFKRNYMNERVSLSAAPAPAAAAAATMLSAASQLPMAVDVHREARLISQTDIGECWRQSAKVARRARLFQTASRAITHATAVGTPNIYLEKAKVLWARGEFHQALSGLQRDRFMEGLRLQSSANYNKSTSDSAAASAAELLLRTVTSDDKLAEAKTLLMEGRWMQQTAQTQVNSIIVQYNKVVSMQPRWEKGFFFLGQFYHAILESESLRMSGCLPHILHNFSHSLMYGNEYVFQSLPRMLSLWLDFGAKVSDSRMMALEKDHKAVMDLIVDGIEPPEKLPKTPPDVLPALTLHRLNVIMRRSVDRIPPYLFYIVFSQLVSRICHSSTSVMRVLEAILLRVLRAYPAQGLWYMMAISKSTHRQRSTRCLEILKRFATQPDVSAEEATTTSAATGSIGRGRSTPNRHVAATVAQQQSGARLASVSFAPLVQTYSTLTDALLRLCNIDLTRSTITSFSLAKSCPELAEFCGEDVLLPLQSSLSATLPQSATMSGTGSNVQFSPFPDSTPNVVKVEDEVEVLSSLQRPRKVTIVASDGKRYFYLAKPKDDLRKDCRVMEFNTMVNKLLKRDPDTRQRQLRIRTYAVVPLNEECGLLEWVQNTEGFRFILQRIYKTRKQYTSASTLWKTVFNPRRVGGANVNDPAVRVVLYIKEVLPCFPPVFGAWFLSMFPDPLAWYAARLAYARTLAVMSMVGYIVGLGDRHGENILFDSSTGEAVHVDFNCLFERGKQFQTAEQVPFRLTPNLVEALGMTGYEGVFRKTCEVTLRLLRNQCDTLMSVLRTCIYDPFVEWGNIQGKVQQAHRAGANSASTSSENPNEEALKTITAIVNRLQGRISDSMPLSIEGQVDDLLLEATDVVKLCQMYIGWMPML